MQFGGHASISCKILCPLSSPCGINTMLTYGNCQSNDENIGNCYMYIQGVAGVFPSTVRPHIG